MTNIERQVNRTPCIIDFPAISLRGSEKLVYRWIPNFNYIHLGCTDLHTQVERQKGIYTNIEGQVDRTLCVLQISPQNI